jgi:hypothetical protein
MHPGVTPSVLERGFEVRRNPRSVGCRVGGSASRRRRSTCRNRSRPKYRVPSPAAHRPFSDQATVGSDISSATQGSSVTKVAGKKRGPTKQWAKARRRRIGGKAEGRAQTLVNTSEAGTLRTLRSAWLSLRDPGGRKSSRAKRRTSGISHRVGEQARKPLVNFQRGDFDTLKKHAIAEDGWRTDHRAGTAIPNRLHSIAAAFQFLEK